MGAAGIRKGFPQLPRPRKEGWNLGASDPISQSAGQAAATLWRNILARVPTIFGRLLFMANLRDQETGRYFHPTFSATLGAEEADRILRHSHYQVFSQWLVFSLAEQKEDLDEFLGEPAARERLSAYRNLAPARAHEVERQLFLTDLETLLELLIVEQSGVSRSRGA